MISYSEARARSHWLLDLEVAGRTWRIATLPVVVATADGEELVYTEGLSDLTLPRVQDGAVEQSVTVDIDLDEDWALLEARGHPLDRGRAVLRRWHEGTVLERARVQIRGLVTQGSYGAQGEGLTVEISRNPMRESDVIPGPQLVATAESWPVRTGGEVLSGTIEGATYPIPIGLPGDMRDSPNPVQAAYCCVPALMVEWKAATADSRLLMAGDHIDLPSGFARIYNATTGFRANGGTNGYNVDGHGRRCTYTSFGGTTAAHAFGTAEDQYFIGLGYDSAASGGSYRGGGILNPYGPGVLRGAGDVLQWALLQHSTIPVDRAYMSSLSASLNRFSIDTWINSQINTWAWCTSAILRWLPVTAREGPQGLYFLPAHWDATMQDVVAYLSADRGQIQRASKIQRLRQDIYNEITVRYRPGRGGQGGRWLSQVTLTSSPGAYAGGVPGGAVADTRVYASYLARLSQVRFGVRPKVIDIPSTWDTVTAGLVAQLFLERHGWPKRTVSYDAGPEYDTIEPGAVVAVTDSRIHLSDALALVADAVVGPAGSRLDLVLLDRPPQLLAT